MKKWIRTAIALLVLTVNIHQTRPLAADKKPEGGATVEVKGATVEVKIDNFSFVPATLTVRAGTTVRWVNHDDIPHNIVGSATKDFKSPVLDTDQKFDYTFKRPGEYPYFCGIHPKMTAKIVVQ